MQHITWCTITWCNTQHNNTMQHITWCTITRCNTQHNNTTQHITRCHLPPCSWSGQTFSPASSWWHQRPWPCHLPCRTTGAAARCCLSTGWLWKWVYSRSTKLVSKCSERPINYALYHITKKFPQRSLWKKNWCRLILLRNNCVKSLCVCTLMKKYIQFLYL